MERVVGTPDNHLPNYLDVYCLRRVVFAIHSADVRFRTRHKGWSRNKMRTISARQSPGCRMENEGWGRLYFFHTCILFEVMVCQKTHRGCCFALMKFQRMDTKLMMFRFRATGFLIRALAVLGLGSFGNCCFWY